MVIAVGLHRQPKWGHLKELHAAVKLCEEPLLSGLNSTISLGKLQTVSKIQRYLLLFGIMKNAVIVIFMSLI